MTSEVDTSETESECDSPNVKKHVQLFIVLELEKRPELLSKSQIPAMKAKKEKALNELVKLYEVNLGKRITLQQLQKKINNMKTRLKKKTDKNRTGNKKIELKDWERILFRIMEGDDNPTVSKIPESIVAGTSKTIEVHAEKKTVLPAPPFATKKAKLMDYETEETKALTTAELHRRVLLEQLKTTRVQRQYFEMKMSSKLQE